MGAYTWLSEQEFESYSKVIDKDINEALHEVRSVMPEWYISQRTETTSSWLGKVHSTNHYTVYMRTGNGAGEPNNEVRVQMSAHSKETVLNLLYGLYMGYQKAINK